MNLLMGVQNLAAERLAGTEHFVLSLSKELAALGAGVTIVAPAPADGTRMDDFGGVRIRYVGDGSGPTKREILTLDEPRFLDEFVAILREAKADLFHLHSSSSVMGIAHQRAARAEGLRTAISLHVAGWFCARYDFLHEGRRQCSQALDPDTCNLCAAKQRFGPKAGPVLVTAARRLGVISLPAARPLNLGKLKVDSIRDHLAVTDVVEVFADWQKDVLVRSGFPARMIAVHRLGVREEFVRIGAETSGAQTDHGGIRVGFCGRINAIKGIETLLDAIEVTDRTDISLSVVGEPVALIDDRVRALVAAGKQVECLGGLNHDELVRWYQSIDVLCVPSNVVEPGPTVTMEAQTLHIPVIVSRMGGNREIVDEGENGFLFEPGDHRELAGIFSRVTREELEGMRARSSYDRTMATVARELSAEYARALAGRGAVQS